MQDEKSGIKKAPEGAFTICMGPWRTFLNQFDTGSRPP
jgi:hypothetical protein